MRYPPPPGGRGDRIRAHILEGGGTVARRAGEKDDLRAHLALEEKLRSIVDVVTTHG